MDEVKEVGKEKQERMDGWVDGLMVGWWPDLAIAGSFWSCLGTVVDTMEPSVDKLQNRQWAV